MDVLRTTCFALGTIDPENTNNNHYLGDRYVRVTFPQVSIKINTDTGPFDSVIMMEKKGNLIIILKVNPLVVKIVDVSLILNVEYDFNSLF